ncbi:MAG TPA: hypothetical protein VHC20_06780 [Candidatus Paceibacterota bacterium]|nr:hypothetical protein [Candidatus Paceibacterota bacterium]
MLAHAPRQPAPWLIFNVGQKMSSAVKVALIVFYVGFLGVFVGAYFAAGKNSLDHSTTLSGAIVGTTVLMSIGAALCWRCGWKRFKEETSGKSIAGFLAYVLFAPISLPFSIR